VLRSFVPIVLAFFAFGCAAARPSKPTTPQGDWTDDAPSTREAAAQEIVSPDAPDEARAALRRGEVVVLAVFTASLPEADPVWSDIDALRSRLPRGATLVVVVDDLTERGIVMQDFAERDLLAESGNWEKKPTVPLLLVVDTEGAVRHVRHDYTAEDLADLTRIVASVRALSDLRAPVDEASTRTR
jgi:hypothetical protein